MAIPDILAQVYQKENVGLVVISITIFFLYSLVFLIEANKEVTEFIVSSNVSLPWHRYLFAYVGAYLGYIQKVTTYMFMFYLLICIIHIAVIVASNIFAPLTGEAYTVIYDKISKAMIDNSIRIFGLYFMPGFFLFFLVLLPLTFLAFAFMYLFRIYYPDGLNKNIDVKYQTMLTINSEMIFLMVLFIMITFVYFIYRYSEKM